MQSSMWSNPSAGMSQPHHNEHHHHEPHHHEHQSEALYNPATHQPQSSTPRHHHDGVWTPPPPPLPQPQAQHQAAAFRLAAGRGFSATSANDDELIRPSVSFPLLTMVDSSSEQSAIPLARRQQNYLQQRQQQLLLQREASEPGLETEAAEPGAPVADEAALKLAMRRKQLRHRALIMVYLSCTLLFVLAVVFLAAFGVFHTAGIQEAAKAAAKAANATDGAGPLLPA